MTPNLNTQAVIDAWHFCGSHKSYVVPLLFMVASLATYKFCWNNIFLQKTKKLCNFESSFYSKFLLSTRSV